MYSYLRSNQRSSSDQGRSYDKFKLHLHSVTYIKYPSLQNFGEILFFGYPRGQYISFDFEDFFHKCCRATTIVGAPCETNQTSTRIALDVIADGEIDVDPMLTHEIPFNDVFDAYELHRTREDEAVKIVIDMP